MVMMYDTEQPRAHISVGISLRQAARLSHTARSHSMSMSNDPPNQSSKLMIGLKTFSLP
jgi:hypothetical protein